MAISKEVKKVVKPVSIKPISLEGLTGLALHHARQKNAKLTGKPMIKATKATQKGGAVKPARTALPIFTAPTDFKPFFLEVFLRTEKDGLLGSTIKAIRYIGRYDPEAEDKKKSDIASYDQPTLIGIMSRFAAVTYATNAAKRLPINTTFKVVLRVNKKAADESLSVLVKSIAIAGKVSKSGRADYTELAKNDLNYRKLRKASRVLPAAFKTILMPPKKVRGVKVVEEDSDE
jgi:hypothetical protein